MAESKRFFVIGDPIAHSLSPLMQQAALRHLGLRHSYEALRVSPYELAGVLDRVRRGDIHGLNVTVPHKVAALRLCDFFTDEVATTGAVNTVFVDATGRLVGSNTDVDGLRADILGQSIVPKRVLVLGAGGAARAAVVSIATLGATVDVAARRDDQAARLVKDVTMGGHVPWATLHPKDGATYDLVVNATSAGMSGGAPGDDIADAFVRAPKTPATIAYDLVYRPPAGERETKFLAAARASGHRGFDGLGMLVEQGVRALSIFLGTPIDTGVRVAMRQAVTAAVHPGV
ncbi:MAG: shikimate dehydrogenase [Polyangiales bacterium]